MDYGSSGPGSPYTLLLVSSLASPGSVYVFPVAWLGCGALQGEITTWLQWLFKANRALTICQAC